MILCRVFLQIYRRTLCLGAMATSAITAGAPKMLRVRCLRGDKLDLIFDDCWGSHHELARYKKEHVGKALKRMELSILKKARKRKSNADDASLPFEVRLYTPTGDLVGGEVPNQAAWMEQGMLEVGSDHYVVQVNPPTVLSLKLPENFRTGCPVVPEVMLEFSDIHLCKWRWFRYPLSDASCASSTPHSSELTHQVLSTNYTYWPSEDDVGYQLFVECIPTSPDGRIGELVTAISPVITSQSAKDTPITRRHLLTPWQLVEPDRFRMVSYNTLASIFTAPDGYGQRVLYPYCQPRVLDIQYRQGSLVHELIGYNADVISLQEVGTSTFENYFFPAFKDKGYESFHQQKPGSVNEGEAIIFNAAKFRLVDSQSTRIGDFFKSDPSCSQLYQGLQTASSFQKEVLMKSSIVLVGLLQSVECSNRYLMVANTHLYYHPKGDHIRLVQAAVMLNYLRTRLDCYSASLGDGARIATVIGGDFNSCPCIAAYQYLVTGAVEKDHKDWMVYRSREIPRCSCECKYNVLEVGGGKGEVASSGISLPAHIQFKLDQEEHLDTSPWSGDGFAGLNLRHDFHFHNVTGTENLTNYTAGFKAVLDYIFVESDKLAVDRVISLPSLEEMSEFVALPSVHFPSDHLALVADLNWR